MRKVIKLTERDLTRIVKRVIKESHKKELNLRDKLNDIFFGTDETNITSDQGERGYLSQEYRLSKKISPRQRIERISQVIEELEDYISDLKDGIGSEESYIKNPTYDEIWGDIESQS
jgi:hypothetical protein